MKYSSIEFLTKRKKNYCKIGFNQLETTGKGLEHFNAEYSKKTDQPITKAIDDIKMRLECHLMFASEFIDNSINLDETMDYEKYFKEFAHQQDSRFEGVEVTKVQFIANKEDKLHAVKIFGKKVTQHTDKEFTNKFSTPVIQLNKDSDNYYALVSILDGQINDLIIGIDEYVAKCAAIVNSQLKIA